MKQLKDGTMIPLEVTRTVIRRDGSREITKKNCDQVKPTQPRPTQSVQTLKRDSSLVITGLQYHNNAQSIVINRLGPNRNIKVTLKRKSVNEAKNLLL